MGPLFLLIALAFAQDGPPDLKAYRFEVYAKNGSDYKFKHLLDFVFAGTRYTDAQRDTFLKEVHASSPDTRAAVWKKVDDLLGAAGTEEDAGGKRLQKYLSDTKLPPEALYFLSDVDAHRRAILARWGKGSGAKNWRQNCLESVGLPYERTRCDYRRDDLNTEMEPLLAAQKVRKWGWRNIQVNEDPKAKTNFNMHNVACYIYDHEGVKAYFVPDSWSNLMLSARDWFWFWDTSDGKKVFHLLDAAGDASFCDAAAHEKVNTAQHEAAASEKFLKDSKVDGGNVKEAMKRAGLKP